LTADEWQKQNPTFAEYLQKAEDRAAASAKLRTMFLPELAILAFRAGELAKAEQYAHETLLRPSDVYDSIHAANTVLGLIALRHDDVAGAGAYLLAATKTKGTSLMDRYGPNLALAKELLDKGQNGVVLEYFQACKSFITKNPKLDDWIAMLKGGRAPDFKYEPLWRP
jgi:hypothetical protein